MTVAEARREYRGFMSRMDVAFAFGHGCSISGSHRVGAYVRDNVRGYFHPVGTCKMGPGEIRRGG